uniref:Protein kinase domain-containing protein n=1 Tax=Panagrolaimus sp. PS1159 TaxID=55785 RepID=A0AC35F7D6_9BILA
MDGDLGNYINEQKLNNSNIEIYQFLNWSKQIADGLFFLNFKKIIHGDLKSKNIFLTKNKTQAKIGDYDDRFLIKNGKINLPNGTEGWHAPETIKGIWTHKADVFSFALILWSMFTLKEPENMINIEEEM